MTEVGLGRIMPRFTQHSSQEFDLPPGPRRLQTLAPRCFEFGITQCGLFSH